MFKKKFSLLLSIYMYNVCTYIPKNDKDGNPRDNYPEGGGGWGGKARCGVIDHVSENIIISILGIK